jgi:copper homeostasis protein (lipoprotein)
MTRCLCVGRWAAALALLLAGPVLAQAPARAVDGPRLMSPLGTLPASFVDNPARPADEGTAMARAPSWQLDLLPGGRFQLRRAGPGRPTSTDEIGVYALEGRRLTLDGSAGIPLVLTLEDDGALQPLDAQAAPRLERLPAAVPIEPRLRLSGWFSHVADAARWVLCADGRSLPVAMASDFQALERAYAAARPVPGAPVWAEVDALIAARPSMESGQPPQVTLTVERFVQVDPQARCPGPYADRRLTGTGWRLAWLGRDPVRPRDPADPPALRLNAGRVTGSDGCNRFTGPAAVGGEALRLGPLAGIRRACAEGNEQARAFTDALARVRRHQIRGDELSLLDDAGLTLARLQAVP